MNIYWPVYKNLEKSLEELTFSIHISDDQLDVYSSRITDLILRAAIEIETLAKVLYVEAGGSKDSHIKYDDVAIQFLKREWLLDKKPIVISSANCFQSDRVLFPFVKNETRTGTAKQTYGWNNAYQHLKHDRSNSMKYGSLRYLFDIMAALFLLNLYFKDEETEVGDDSKATSFPTNAGSDIFSITLENRVGHDGDGKYLKYDNFEEAVYFVDQTEKAAKEWAAVWAKFNAKQNELLLNHPKFTEYFEKNGIEALAQSGWGIRAVGDTAYQQIMQQTMRAVPLNKVKSEYRVRLNKNQV